MPFHPGEGVAILLSTFNGGRHLSRQLDSIFDQQHERWTVYASDDGSTDATLSILNAYRARWGGERLVIMGGPRSGYADNFMSLVRHPGVVGDFFAFCDQDDVWRPEKLARALDWMRAQPTGLPALNCGRTRLIDIHDRPHGYSPLFRYHPGFANALVQSLAGGNTMLFNLPARTLMASSPFSVSSHDWWAYLVVTGCGGHVHYDPDPTVGYRQHDENLIGSDSGFRARLDRLGEMFSGSYQAWNDVNLAGLHAIERHLAPDSLSVLDAFEQARSAWLMKRLWLLARAGVYRQTAYGNLALMLAATIGKI